MAVSKKGLKEKGAKFERGTRDELAKVGIHVSRNALSGEQFDRGDLLGIDDVTLQCKCYDDMLRGIREGLTGAKEQAAHQGNTHPIAIVKRVRKPVSQAYAVMELQDLAVLLAEFIGLKAAMKHMVEQYTQSSNARNERLSK